MRILGIDPGFGRMGYGVIEQVKGKWTHVAHGLVETPPKKSFVERLEQLHNELNELIKKYRPTQAGVEELFFAKNVTTAIQVGQARGVILLTLVQHKISVYEFTPLEVKQAITGYGRAEKQQIQKMIPLLLDMKKIRLQDDAADALAIALTTGVSSEFFKKIGKR